MTKTEAQRAASHRYWEKNRERLAESNQLSTRNTRASKTGMPAIAKYMTCTCCLKRKHFSEFNYNLGGHGYLNTLAATMCKICRKAATDKRKSKKRTAGHRGWYIKHTYGMTLAQWEDMFNSQGRACAICQATESKQWNTDHDHACCPGAKTCGRCVRGILCEPCNRAIGLFHDDYATLLSAADYLLKDVDLIGARL